MKHNAILFGVNGGIGRSIKDKLENNPSINKLICFSRSINTNKYYIDYNDEKSIQKAASYIQSKNIQPTIIIIATGILSDLNNRPETQINQFSVEWAQKNYLINAIGPALIAKHFLPLMPRDKDIYFAAISAKVGSISDNALGG